MQVQAVTKKRTDVQVTAGIDVGKDWLDAISIDEITEAADVAKGTFYTHFEDKDDLAVAIGYHIRIELEGRITRLNEGVKDAGLRMANGLSSLLAFAIVQPVRARALLRLIPGSVDPDTPINAGIRSDIALGMKAKVFSVSSLNAAVVVILGIAMSAAMRVTEVASPVTSPYDFSADAIGMALAALGVKQGEALRLAKLAMTNRKKELNS